MKKICFLALFVIPALSFAQRINTTIILDDKNVFLKDINGVPLRVANDMQINGSPYFSKDYCIANVKVVRGRKYNGIEVKLNLQENKLVFKLADGNELESTVPIEQIEFVQCENNGKTAVFRSGYPAISRQNEGNYYEILDSGRVQLLKYWNVSYMDQSPYGSMRQRTYESSPVYYAFSAEKGMVALGRGNEQALQVLGDKKDDITKFISGQNIRMKKEEDLVKLFSYYNSLSK